MKKTIFLLLILLLPVCLSAQDEYLYWTDVHYPHNNGAIAAMMREAAKGKKAVKVVFGGDATVNTAASEFPAALDSFFCDLGRIRKFAKLYLTRGNHDFQTRQDYSLTSDNLKTASMIRSAMNGRVVRNKADKTANYWFFDNKKARIRYIALDSTDSVVDFKVKYGFGDTQLDWIFNKAMLTTPEGYGVVFFFHTPVCPDCNPSQVQALVCSAIESMAAGRDFRWKGGVVPFSRLKNVKLIYVQNGHRHMDYAEYHNGVLHILTTADTQGYKSGINIFDLVSIDKDFKTLDMKRTGLGSSRLFNLERIVLNPGESIALKSSVEGKWSSYDGCGNVYPKKSERKFKQGWTFSNTVVSVDGGGGVVAKKSGEALVLVSGNDKTEYFTIKVN